MLYSPVRYSVYHSVSPLHGTVVQLACVTHAASVHPEPGSNSQLIDLLGLIAKLTIPLRNTYLERHRSILPLPFMARL